MQAGAIQEPPARAGSLNHEEMGKQERCPSQGQWWEEGLEVLDVETSMGLYPLPLKLLTTQKK